ncbi:MAG: prolyl oligopeptidase family serine peptidase, partial [Bacteroidales bacterium]|nr:prolyl oligopeptidase family serine peptidase [Bacteroidales bacterium]
MDDVRISKKGDCETVLAYSNYPYEHLIQWSSANIRDYWFVNIENGEKKKFATAFEGTVSLSPGGKFAIIYDKQDSTWYMHDLRRSLSYPITDLTDVGFYNDEYDQPGLPPNYGIAGWLKNDRAVILYDKYDLWLCNAGKDGEIINITNSFGRDNNIVLRFIKTDKDSEYIDEHELVILHGFNKISKEATIYTLDIETGTLNLIFSANMSVGNITKAKNAEVYSFSKSDFSTYPDRYIVKDNADWNNSLKITEINPQQKDYSWGSVELYSWFDFNGDSVSGLLYKPEDFDPNMKYPMLVYFYEKYSDHLYAHYIPAPSRSVINFPLFTSNGYIVFIPDIKYKTGSPGKDAYNSIVSGTYSLIEKGFVNKDKIGLQGQSWGGYQVAYLVTQTDLYACAMAGAAVSNMTSAYGGLRMEGGNSRMMQYEEGQSRIGANMWENLPAYIENSPVFYADKINTPLLMMHNDGDGAVPWSQGIELFLAMKRLNKPVWLLNYNGEEHNLKNRANCKDLSVRMSEFFDYYLKDAPCPKWLEIGVPAVWKGSR